MAILCFRDSRALSEWCHMVLRLGRRRSEKSLVQIWKGTGQFADFDSFFCALEATLGQFRMILSFLMYIFTVRAALRSAAETSNQTAAAERNAVARAKRGGACVLKEKAGLYVKLLLMTKRKRKWGRAHKLPLS